MTPVDTSAAPARTSAANAPSVLDADPVGITPCVASADFVRAISDLLDTDPADLLSELGYYGRAGRSAGDDRPTDRDA